MPSGFDPNAFLTNTGPMPNQYGIDTSGVRDGALGGYISGIHEQMGQEQYGLMKQGQELDLADKSRQSGAAQKLEDMTGDLSRSVAQQGLQEQHDLYSSGIIHKGNESKYLTEIDSNEHKQLINKIDSLDAANQVSLSLREASQKNGGTLNPGMIDQANQVRQKVGMPKLPDDPAGANAMIQSEAALAEHSAPRLAELRKQMNTMELEKAKTTSAEKVATIHGQATVEAADISAHSWKSPQSVAADVIKRYNADPKSVNSREISMIEDNLIAQQGDKVNNQIENKLDSIRRANNGKLSESDKLQARMDVYKQIPSWAALENARLERMAAEKTSGTAPPASPTGASPPQAGGADLAKFEGQTGTFKGVHGTVTNGVLVPDGK